jgi:glycosyltransferase involved in cell wall biosynthesis
VYPSFYEGFGIPPLEAMCCETAVIAARTSSIPEVVGDGGLLVDPRDLEELGDAMLRVYRDSGLRERLVEKGRQRAKLFSWDRTARETFNVYKSVAG